jgi:hypothetical protein
MNIQVHPGLRKAFHFIPGEILRFKLDQPSPGQVVEWEVKYDLYLNKYIECNISGARAYFRTDDAMLHFTHFEGDRKSLLYHFYLAAYKVCFGYYENLSIKDTYPINMVFDTPQLILHDFTAPFFQYMSGKYELSYSGAGDILSEPHITLKSQSSAMLFRKVKKRITASILVDRPGIQIIEIEAGKRKYLAHRFEQPREPRPSPRHQ